MSHRTGLMRDSAFTPARAAAPDESLGSPFLAFCAKALSPIPLQAPAGPEGRFFKTPAPPVFGGGAATAGVDGTTRKRPDVAPLPLSAPLHFVASADGRGGAGRARGPARDLASLGAAAHAGDADARLVRGAGFSFSGLALGLDSPRVPPSGGARRMAARPREEADPAAHAFAARQAGAAAATTAAKSLRRALAESPQSASAAAAIRRRCLTFETPRPGSARARARAASTPGAGGSARTPQPGAFTTPGPRRRGRASLDSAPGTGGVALPETPDFGDADGVQQLPQPRRSGGGGSCRKCHCKKSKCLKLYCECFASGTYCDSGDGVACNCQNCLNTPCNAALVAQTRQLIESRNPLAFCPKIVVKSLNGDDADDETPRHKRGCHCKKSNCLKRYCECYQAGVLCTEACRCDGCKNCSASGGGGHQQGPFALPAAHAPVRSSLRAAGSTPLPNTPALVMCEPQLTAVFTM